MKVKVLLLALNVGLAGVLFVGSVADAQTGPAEKRNCCQLSASYVKFCCERCCTSGDCPATGCANWKGNEE